MPPTTFDIWSLVITVLVGVVPVALTLVLWRSDHRAAEKRLLAVRRTAAVRAVIDATLAAEPAVLGTELRESMFKTRVALPVHELLAAYEVGAWPLLHSVDQWVDHTASLLDWELSQTKSPEDLAPKLLVDATYEFRRLVELWDSSGAFRAELFRSLTLAQQVSEYGGEDKLSPSEFHRLVRDQILLNRSWHPWLRGTRLSPWNILLGRVRAKLRLRPAR